MTDQPDPITYGPTGYTCGCGKTAHSNLTPCAPDPIAPSPRSVPQLADVQAAFGVSAEEAAANIKTNVPFLAAIGRPAAEACTDSRHTGPIRAQLGCTGPDPAAAGEPYPTRLGVYCDTCGTEWRGDFIVSDTMSKAQRLDVVRAHVRTELGWQCDAAGDFCPECEPSAPTAEQAAAAPRTERAYWQDIADALNAAQAAGMPVGIELDGTLTDHRAWSVVWDRNAERWTLTGYEGDEDQEQPFAWLTGTTTEPTEPASPDLFTEAAIRHATLTAAADTIENLPQDYECDPGRGDAVKLLRRMAAFHTTAEQPAGLTWEARAEHAVRLYATTAIERDDARAEIAKLHTKIAELCDRLDAAPADIEARAEDTARRLRAVEQLCSGRPVNRTVTVKALLTAMGEADDEGQEQPLAVVGSYVRAGLAKGLAPAELEQDQADADFIAPLETAVMEQPEPTDLTERPEDAARRLDRARAWAVEELRYTERTALLAILNDDQPDKQPAVPAVGDRYVSRTVNRTVTVTRVWQAEDGHTAVAYEWRDDRPGQCGSACPLDVFHRKYLAEPRR
ncbi:hypothetical protein [Streptomyces nitrosporeus]|uniref:hypothetical protein n=1 Tax=Streptomyces nitrosporeus TaxID=28894 RepID=UPI0039A31BF4